MAQGSFVAEAHGNGNTASNNFTFDIAKPTGTIDGDLMIAHIQTSDSAVTVATLTGWTLKDSDTTAGNGATYIFYKIASSEGSTYTWSVNTGGVGGNKGALGAISTWRNTHQTTPIGQYSKNVDTTSNTTAVGTAITPNRAPDALLVAFTSNLGAELSYSAHSIANNNPTWTEVYDTTANGGAPALESIVCAYGLYPYITTTGAYNATISGSAKSTTYLMMIQSADFNFAGAFALTSAINANESGAYSIPAGFQAIGTLSATVATGVAKFTNLIKSATTWINQSKS